MAYVQLTVVLTATPSKSTNPERSERVWRQVHDKGEGCMGIGNAMTREGKQKSGIQVSECRPSVRDRVSGHQDEEVVRSFSREHRKMGKAHEANSVPAAVKRISCWRIRHGFLI